MGYSDFSLDQLLQALDNLTQISGDITDIISFISTLLSLGLSGITLLGTIITAVVTSIITLISLIFHALPIFRLSRKMGRKSAWFAWIPFFGFRMYALCAIPGAQPLRLYKDKWVIKNRNLSFWIYYLILLGGNAIITLLITILGVIPVLGQTIAPLTTLLYMLPAFICGYIRFLYIKDVLDIFKEDKKSNTITSIIIVLLDHFVTGGLARTFYLYTLWNREPIPTETVDSL